MIDMHSYACLVGVLITGLSRTKPDDRGGAIHRVSCTDTGATSTLMVDVNAGTTHTLILTKFITPSTALFLHKNVKSLIFHPLLMPPYSDNGMDVIHKQFRRKRRCTLEMSAPKFQRGFELAKVGAESNALAPRVLKIPM